MQLKRLLITVCVLYLVFVELLDVHRCESEASVSPFVEVLGEMAFQLEAATLVQIIDTGHHAPERNAATQHTA